MKVLVLDDNDAMHEMLNDTLVGKDIEIISAYNIKECRAKIEGNPGINVIVFDACVPGTIMNTDSLVREIRPKFSGLMIGVSSSKYYQDDLVAAGCDLKCEKWLLAQVLEDIIDGKVSRK